MIQIELEPEIEARLTAEAQARALELRREKFLQTIGL
jgi:hypothetical protein